MRDFLEYVERSKEDSPNSLDFYMEGFGKDISKMEQSNPIHTFILGFLVGKGIDIKANSQYIMNLINSDETISSPSQAIANVRNLDVEAVKEFRTSLASVLATLRTIVKDHKKKEESEKMM